MPNAVNYLPAPPDSLSQHFAYDTAQYQWGKRMRSTQRGEQARLDAEYSIERMSAIFSPAVGITIDKEQTPQLWKLLADANETAHNGCSLAKKHYMRTRPYVYYNEPSLVPGDEDVLRHNGSYPSGHTTLGWTTALILVELFPEQQDEILRIGYEYGQSRVIAGYHWQSDVDAGRLVASAAFAKLHTSGKYLKQLNKAKEEIKKAKK